MIKKILIIYIEAHEKHHEENILKQEKQLFQNEDSMIIWDKYFKKLGFTKHKFFLLPLHYKNEENKKKWLSFLNEEVEELKNKKILKIIITGDHDEKETKYFKVLLKREELANEIFKKFNNKFTKIKIILKREKTFKIEKIMEEIIDQDKISKKSLKEKFNGNTFPTIEELKKYTYPPIENKKIINNLINSKHPLFIEILASIF